MRIAIVIVLVSMNSVGGHASEARWTRGEQAVTVRVHDYVHVDQAVIVGAQSLVASYYSDVGVRTEWMTTVRQDATPASTHVGGRLEDFTVVVLSRSMAARKGMAINATGSAAIGLGQMGRIVYVRYDQLKDAAVAAAWPTKNLLAVVIAHELGHLLLPPGSHSADGLMRGDWSLADLRRTNGPRLAFTRGQGALMREVLADAGSRERSSPDDAPAMPRSSATLWTRGAEPR